LHFYLTRSCHTVLANLAVEEFMRRLAAILFVTALCVPAVAQWQRWNLSSDDQQRFDSYYSRWQE